MQENFDTNAVYETIKRKIVRMEYMPGDVLNEQDIADEYKISRTPVRKILSQLSADKLINIIPRFGAQVAPIDFKYMKSVFEVTRILDPYAASQAISRITPEQIAKLEEIICRLKSYSISTDYQAAVDDDEHFHIIIYKNCGNLCVDEILSGLHCHTERLWHYSEQYIKDISIFYDTLGLILEAIKNNDVEKVEQYAREHIDAFVENIKQAML